MIAHVFVDAENIPPSVTFKVVEHFGQEHTITRVDIVAKKDTMPYKYRGLDKNIYRVQNCFYGKNSADTWLCMEMVRAIIDEPDLELIIIVSSDKDFLPAIKFAVDFEKKVLIVSNGNGHRILSAQLKILGVDPAAVELKDYRLNFSAPAKLEKFLPLMSFTTKKFFFEREEKIKFILLKRNGILSEAPFVNGMGLSTFGRAMRELNILYHGDSIRDFIAENFLKATRDKVYFQSETEISTPTTAELIDQYFEEHAAETIKIFIRHNGKLHEIPFVNGMPFDTFGKLLRERKIIGKGASIAQTAGHSLLKVRSGNVFLCNDEEQLELYGNTIKDVAEFLSFHAASVKKILIKNGGRTFEVPFVNGMTLEMFGKLLREKNIIGRSASPSSIAKKNFLDVQDSRVFLCDEDRLIEVYAETSGNLDPYFEYHAEDATKIFVKHNGDLFEIPFINGMPLALFDKILRDKKIIGRNSSAKKVAAQSLLEVSYERVYLIPEDEMAAALDDMETNVDGFFNRNALQIKSISIRHDGEEFDLPFVNGMPLKVFGKLLRERKIIDRKTPAEEILADNNLELRDEKIFKRKLAALKKFSTR